MHTVCEPNEGEENAHDTQINDDPAGQGVRTSDTGATIVVVVGKW